MRKPNGRPWTLAGASAVPRASQRAPCRAGSQERLGRAGSWEASSGKPPFDRPSRQGSHFLHRARPARDLRGHGAQPRWTHAASGALRGAGPRQVTRPVGHWGQRGGHSAHPGPPPLSGSLASSGSAGSRQGGPAPSDLSAVGGPFPVRAELVQRPLEWGGGAWTAQGGGGVGEWVFKSQRLLYLSRV